MADFGRPNLNLVQSYQVRVDTIQGGEYTGAAAVDTEFVRPVSYKFLCHRAEEWR